MSAPPRSPPSGGATTSESDYSPSDDGSSSPPAAPAPGSGSSVASWSSSTPPPDARGGTPSAPPPPTPPGCAACKHKRQKCPPGCVLLPYFPADDPDKFRSVLRVFGVKNLLRTLREVPRPRWDACVRTLVYEARARLMDPVRGCVGVVEDLEAQLLDTAVELEVLRRRQEAYRQQAKRRLGLLQIQPPNPRGPTATTSPRGETNLDAVREQSGRTTTRDDMMMQPQGPYGTAAAAWTPATAGLAATRPRLSPTQPPQFPATQPGFSAVQSQELSAWPPAATGLTATQPQLFAWPPPTDGLAATQPQFSAMQPQLSATQQEFSAMQPQFSAMQPRLSEMQQPQPQIHQQPIRRAIAMTVDDLGNAWETTTGVNPAICDDIVVTRNLTE